MIGVVGDWDPRNPTHVATSSALEDLPGDVPFEWTGTDEVAARWSRDGGWSGVFIGPGSPYRDTGAVLDVIRDARERGISLVGT
ncbi:MAG: hypothetical protein M3271_00450 [Actinomycetota bacterium]|nr:hypothetical protein [Actinomycetota bacterium]